MGNRQTASLIYFFALLFPVLIGCYSPIYARKLRSSKINADSIPLWIREMYTKVDSSEGPLVTREVICYRQLTDTSSFCLYTYSTGTCFRTYLATQRNHKDFQQYNIYEECDEDLGEPEYTYYTYSLDSTHNIIAIKYDTTRAKAKYVRHEGNVTEFKDGFDLDSVETWHIIKTRYLIIRRNGSFVIRDKRNLGR